MNKIELKSRTQRFAVDVIRFIESLPNSRSLNVLSNQLLRSSTSFVANYGSACKGKSTADFINKIIICEEDADESIYWLDLMMEKLVAESKVLPLRREANEPYAIFTAIGKTAKENQKSKNLKN